MYVYTYMYIHVCVCVYVYVYFFTHMYVGSGKFFGDDQISEIKFRFLPQIFGEEGLMKKINLAL